MERAIMANARKAERKREEENDRDTASSGRHARNGDARTSRHAVALSFSLEKKREKIGVLKRGRDRFGNQDGDRCLREGKRGR